MKRFANATGSFAIWATIGSLFSVPILGWAAPIATVAAIVTGAYVVHKLRLDD